MIILYVLVLTPLGLVIYVLASRTKGEKFSTSKLLTETETAGITSLPTIDLLSTIKSAINDVDGPLLTYTARPGMIVMISSEKVPTGWQLCNGHGKCSDGTAIPNLLGYFPFGAPNKEGLGVTGGKPQFPLNDGQVILTVDQIPSHTHTMPFAGWTHGGDPGQKALDAASYYFGDGNQYKPVANSAAPITATGGGSPIDIMPPNLGVYFIIKL